MIKMRNFKEKWVDGVKVKPRWEDEGYFEIFKNPTTKELKKANGYETRGIVLRNGSFYIVLPSKKLIHVELLQVLLKARIVSGTWTDCNGFDTWGTDSNSLSEFLCIVQIKDTLKFERAESYGIEIELDVFSHYKENFEKENSNYTLNYDE